MKYIRNIILQAKISEGDDDDAKTAFIMLIKIYYNVDFQFY